MSKIERGASKEDPERDNKSSSVVVGFDFDLTLSCRRVYGRRDFDHLQDVLFGGTERIAELRQLFAFLVEHCGARIVVISWNFQDIIAEALAALELQCYVCSIYDRPSMKDHGGYRWGKRNIMNALSVKWKIPKENMLFVDDSHEVLDNMSCQTVWIQNAAGITPTEMQLVARKVARMVEPRRL
jgi:hypothetical protein